MKQFALMIALLTGVYCSSIAQNYSLAMGIRGGVPGGFTAKKMLDDWNGLEFLVGTEFDKRLNITVLYEFHGYLNEYANWYAGLGGSINPGNGVGPRGDAIAGVEYTFINFPINISLDWKPVYVIKNSEFVPNRFAISIRFLFHR